MSELANALIAESAHAAPFKILLAIRDELALARVPLAPHSIYEEVWHMAFWQQLSLDWVTGTPTPGPEDPALGFSTDTSEPWPSLHDRFLIGAEAASVIAADTKSLDRLVLCPNFSGPHRRMSIQDQLVSLAAHNAYHFGRIVLLRQMLKIWPPPDGGYAW